MRNRLINTIGRFVGVRGQALPRLDTPQLIVEVAEPNEVRLDATFDGDTTGNVFEYADNINFQNSTVVTNQVFPFTLLAEDLNQPITDYYFRLRATAQGFRPSNFANFATGPMEQIPVSVTNLQAQEGNNQVVLSWTSNANIESVVIERRTTGQFQPIGTTTNETFTDEAVVNGTTYEYRVIAVPVNFNFVGQPSAVVSATPSGTPQLAMPTGLQLIESGTNGTLTFSWLAVSGATSYDVLLDGVLQVNQSGTSFEFEGLNVGQLYAFGVIAKADGFIDSNQAVRNYAPIDNDAEFLTPEQFGAEAYYKPLDGRLSNGFEFPLVNLTPLDEVAFNALNTGLSFTDYPNGVTLLQPVNSSEEPIQGVFDPADVGKTFCGLRCHRNGAEGEFDDEYPPFGVSSRYSTVIWQDGNICLVDFDYNGLGDMPQPTVKGKGYIFFDNSQALTATFAAWRNLAVSENIRLMPVVRSGYLLTVYVAPQLDTTAVNVQKNCLINTGSALRARIKWGVEDYWHLGFGVKPKKYIQPANIFAFNNYGGKFITHNIQWVTAHGATISSRTFVKRLGQGSLSGGGVFFVVNGENYIEFNELQAGNGAENYLFTQGFHSIGSINNYTEGQGELNDVNGFAFVGGYNVHYTGVYAAGNIGGAARGGLFEFLKNFKVDFEPQNKYAPVTQVFEAKFTNDFSGLAQGADLSYLPTRCIEITSNNGNWFFTKDGGSNRTAIVHVDKFIFNANMNRVPFLNYYNPYYNGNKTTFETTGDGLNAVNSKKILVDWDIVTEKEEDGVTPKYITAQRDYRQFLIQSQMSPQGSIPPSIGLPFRNSVRTHSNWNTAFGKLANQITPEDRDYIFAKDRKPKEWQVGDQFKICAWVDVDDITGLAEGQTVTGNISGSTGVIREIDTYLYQDRNRVKIGSATGSFHTDTELNGKIIVDASNFDPTQVYTFIRKQRGEFGGSDRRSVLQFTEPDNFANGVTVTGLTSGATATVLGVAANSQRGGQNVRMVSGQFVAGEVVTDGTNTRVIVQGGDFENANGQIYVFSGGDYANGGVAMGFIHDYHYAYLMTNIDMPDRINGFDDTIPNFEVEVVNSEAEYLLDGQSRPTRSTYIGVPRFSNNHDNLNNRRRVTTGGYANGYPGLTGFDSAPWVLGGSSSGHLLYSVGEITRMWYDGDANNSFARVNSTSFNLNQLQRYTKGWFIKNVTNPPIGEWRSAQAGSTRQQLERQREIYENNPEYSPQWAADEGLPERPKLWLMGSNSADQMQGWVDPTGQNIVRDSNAANAPDIPNTLKDILIELGEI